MAKEYSGYGGEFFYVAPKLGSLGQLSEPLWHCFGRGLKKFSTIKDYTLAAPKLSRFNDFRLHFQNTVHHKLDCIQQRLSCSMNWQQLPNFGLAKCRQAYDGECFKIKQKKTKATHFCWPRCRQAYGEEYFTTPRASATPRS